MTPARGSLAILSALLLISCSTTEAQRQHADGGPATHTDSSAGIPVVTAKADVRAMPVTLEVVGTAEAISSVSVRAQITGQLQEVLFSPGQDVRKGQPLFSLDRRPLEAALRQAEAIVAKDEAQLANAAADRRRADELFKEGILARSDYDASIAAASALEATLAADRAEAEQARLNLQYSRIVSPLDGQTGALNLHVGDVVRTNDAEPLVTINQLAPIYVTFSVPARFLSEIRKAQAAGALAVTATARRGATPASPRETSDASSPPAARGRVTFIDNSVDSTTATIKLKATFPNRDRELWPGLFVQVSLQLAVQPDAVVVPAVAVQASQQGQYVYIVKPDHTVELRHVTVDRQQGDAAVIANGVKGGEEVVTEGQLRLTPGARVTAGTRPTTAS